MARVARHSTAVTVGMLVLTLLLLLASGCAQSSRKPAPSAYCVTNSLKYTALT